MASSLCESLLDVGSKVQFFFFFFLYCSVAEPGLNPENIWGCQSSLKRATFFYPLPLFLLITTPKWQVSHSCRLSLIKDFFWLLTPKHRSEKKNFKNITLSYTLQNFRKYEEIFFYYLWPTVWELCVIVSSPYLFLAGHYSVHIKEFQMFWLYDGQSILYVSLFNQTQPITQNFRSGKYFKIQHISLQGLSTLAGWLKVSCYPTWNKCLTRTHLVLFNVCRSTTECLPPAVYVMFFFYCHFIFNFSIMSMMTNFHDRFSVLPARPLSWSLVGYGNKFKHLWRESHFQ